MRQQQEPHATRYRAAVQIISTLSVFAEPLRACFSHQQTARPRRQLARHGSRYPALRLALTACRTCTRQNELCRELWKSLLQVDVHATDQDTMRLDTADLDGMQHSSSSSMEVIHRHL